LTSAAVSRYSDAGPILNDKARHVRQIAVGTDDGAIAQAASDGGDLHIDQLHRPTSAAQFREDAPEFLRSGTIERPANDVG